MGVIDVLEKNKIIFLLICFCLANFNATSMVVDLAIIVVPVLHFRAEVEFVNAVTAGGSVKVLPAV